jgi:hypothetical protein
VLRDIALDQYDRDNHLVRRLFADRMVIVREAHGLLILLQDGSQVRGDQKAPFLDGRFRIFLPRADADAWEKAGVPGLAADASVPKPALAAPADPSDPPPPQQTSPSESTASPRGSAPAPQSTPPGQPAPPEPRKG